MGLTVITEKYLLWASAFVKGVLSCTSFRSPFFLEDRCRLCYLKGNYEITLTETELDSNNERTHTMIMCRGCLDEIKIKMQLIKNEDERYSERN